MKRGDIIWERVKEKKRIKIEELYSKIEAIDLELDISL